MCFCVPTLRRPRITRFVLAFATSLPLAAQSADRITGKSFATRSEQ